MLIFSNNTKQRKGVLPKGQSRNWWYLLTIYIEIPGKEEILVEKSNGSRHSVREALQDMNCVCGKLCNNFIFVLVCSADFDILHSGSFSHHIKFYKMVSTLDFLKYGNDR